MRKEVIGVYVFAFGVIFLLGAFFLLPFKGLTGFAVFDDTGQGDFDLGFYSNTEWNGSAVVLSSENLEGNYTSQVFDAGDDSEWNNLSWIGNQEEAEFLLGVDGAGDVYKSTDGGESWTQITDNYGRTSATQDIFVGNYLFILSSSGNEVWRSSYSGESWSIVNDSAMSSSPFYGKSDSFGSLFIVVGNGEVYKSLDDGISWTLVGDINSGTQNPKGFAVNSNDELFAVDGTGSVYKSTDGGENWIEQTSNYGGTTATDDMEIDSSDSIYILLNTEVYKSTDDGVSWSVINDSVSPYAHTLMEMAIDSEDNLYILDGIGRTFESNDLGVTWIERSDLNGGASNDPKGIAALFIDSNLSFAVRNCSLSNCADGVWQSADLDNINLEGQYFQYKVDFYRKSVDVNLSLDSVSIDYTVLNSPPSIELNLPQDGGTYGYNESIDLEFSVSDSDGNIDSCWYNINDGANVLISNCENTSFDVVGSGAYNIQIFVNDSNGEEANDSAGFNVQLGAPSISVSYPVGVYLNTSNVIFKYTPDDLDLDSCSLWGNFTGVFERNQTDAGVSDGVENVFSLELDDGAYSWAISCNDSLGNVAISGNKTFYVDTAIPLIALSQPIGTKSSRINVPLKFSINDTSPVSCVYNVFQGASVEISNTTINCGSGVGNFTVSSDADYLLNFYVNDSAGWQNNMTSSFSIDSSVVEPVNEDGGGGGGTVFLPEKVYNETSEIEIGFQLPNEIIAKSGSSENFNVRVSNKEKIFLNSCGLIFSGLAGGFLQSSQVIGLSPGEEFDFSASANIPLEIEPGLYNVGVMLQCREGRAETALDINIFRNVFGVEVLDYRREGGNLYVNYLVSEYSGEPHTLSLSYSFADLEGITRYRDSFVLELGPAEVKEGEIVFALPKDSFGEFVFNLYASEGEIEAESSRAVFLSSQTGLTGLAISDENKETLSYLGAGIVVLLFLIIGISLFRRFKRKTRKMGTVKKKPKRKLLEFEL